MGTGKEELVLIKDQQVKDREKGGMMTIPPQFLPKNVYQRYEDMMAAMKKDLGKRLYVESGYRSSAYQLYLVVFYLSNHDYSIRETVKFVALPGYSEHGSPEHQAIDFINEDGLGEETAVQFEAQPEFTWLTKNAGKFGFVLSYPKGGKDGITYEPWHWRYERTLDPACK
jgi:D-alanyl-D-alanine carboxypeptidase